MQNLAQMKEQLKQSGVALKALQAKKHPPKSAINKLQEYITKLHYNIAHYGRKFPIVYVRITYQGVELHNSTVMIYYSNVTQDEAEQLVRDKMAESFKIIELVSVPIVPGEPLKMD